MPGTWKVLVEKMVGWKLDEDAEEPFKLIAFIHPEEVKELMVLP